MVCSKPSPPELQKLRKYRDDHFNLSVIFEGHVLTGVFLVVQKLPWFIDMKNQLDICNYHVFHQIVYSGNHGGDGLLETIAPGKRIGNLVFKIYQNISPSKPK